MRNITRKELSEIAADTTGLTPAQTSFVIESFIAQIKKSLADGNTVELRGFATFSGKRRAAKVAQNISKGTPINVPARNIPFCKFHKSVKAKQ